MFWENFARLCESAGKTPTGVSKELGFSNAAASHWKNGKSPTAKTLQKIADYFSVTVNDLLSDTPPAPSKLHREHGEKIAVLASVGAGIPLEAIVTFDQDDPDAWEEISRTDDAQYFALRIRGNSMEPLIRYGEIVIVRKQDEYNDGDIVIALINGDEGVCKLLEYRDNGGICLRSLNPEYPPMVFTREQIENLPVRIMGRCVERRGKL
jgi:repressor LexA